MKELSTRCFVVIASLLLFFSVERPASAQAPLPNANQKALAARLTKLKQEIQAAKLHLEKLEKEHDGISRFFFDPTLPPRKKIVLEGEEVTGIPLHPKDFQVGQKGNFDNYSRPFQFNIVSSLSESSAIVRLSNFPRFVVKGLDTKTLADGAALPLPGNWEVKGVMTAGPSRMFYIEKIPKTDK